ncbi:hypothetical protein AMTRI_Chr02g221610 [Amborella trichopoda]
MILIIFNVLLSTKEPLNSPITNFLVLGEICRGKRKALDEEGLEIEEDGLERERERSGEGGGMEEQLWRRGRHRMKWRMKFLF